MLKDRHYIQALLQQPELMQRILAFNHKRASWMQALSDSVLWHNLQQTWTVESVVSNESVVLGAPVVQALSHDALQHDSHAEQQDNNAEQQDNHADFSELVSSNIKDSPDSQGSLFNQDNSFKLGNFASLDNPTNSIGLGKPDSTSLPSGNFVPETPTPLGLLIENFSHDIVKYLPAYRYQLQTPTAQEQDLWDKLQKANPNLVLFKQESPAFLLFNEPIERLCLLNESEMQTLLMLLGLCRYGEKISKIIWRKQRQQLIETVGQDNYEFCISQENKLTCPEAKPPELQIDNLLTLQLQHEGLCTLGSVVLLFKDPLLQAYLLKHLYELRQSILEHAQTLQQDSTLNSTLDQRFKPSFCSQSQRVAALCKNILNLKVDDKWMQYLS